MEIRPTSGTVLFGTEYPASGHLESALNSGVHVALVGFSKSIQEYICSGEIILDGCVGRFKTNQETSGFPDSMSA